jgi:DNA repair protein RecN (Recombination protein N)
MLSYLRIRGLALLDDVTVELDRGLNVLTGETGAGKSIIVDALTLLRGTRVRSDIVRTGRDAAIVDAEFDLADALGQAARALLDQHGINGNAVDAGLVVQRSVARTGRGRTFVNAELTTLEVLSQLGELLVDICSQHEHHSLTQVGRHIELLDSFAAAELPLDQYAMAYAEYRQLQGEHTALLERTQAANEQREFLRFQLEELERVAPQPGEYEQLKNKLDLLRNAQRWAELARDAEDWLYESEHSIVERLSRLLDRSRRGAEQSPRLADFADQMQVAGDACDEGLRIIKRFVSELELEPGALERAEERLYELSSLRRKHGGDGADLSTRLDALRRNLDELDHATETLTELEQRLDLAHKKALHLAGGLREKRRKAARRLASMLQQELATLHMPLARFEARVEPVDRELLGPRGFDRVEFLLSANPGEALAPLTRVASGGELSRVLLAIRGVLAGSGGVATYVFDEVDAGVGGAIAASIGQRLANAAQHNQVVCVTHLPQIAAFADAHFRVQKQVENERTTTSVVRLSASERIDELARMLGGARITDSARTHALQLIEDAKAQRSRQRPPAASATKRSSRP